MDDEYKVVKHLEIIQEIINRLGHDSFLMKGWSIAILSAGVIFIARSSTQDGWLILAFVVPVIGFWGLDGYFLWQERLFRNIYDDVRKQKTTDFNMNISDQLKKSHNSWWKSALSKTICIFYIIELLFILAVLIILNKT